MARPSFEPWPPDPEANALPLGRSTTWTNGAGKSDNTYEEQDDYLFPRNY